MTVDELVLAVRGQIDEDNTADISDAEVLRVLNRAAKRCTKCGLEKPSTEYSKYKGGLRPSCRQCVHQTYVENREYRLRWQSEYRAANKERIIASDRKYRKNNKSEIAQRRAKKRGEHANDVSIRRARMCGSDVASCYKEKMLIKALYTARDIFNNTFKYAFHVDHIIPLSRGGTHSFSNLQLMTAEDNLRKGTRI